MIFTIGTGCWSIIFDYLQVADQVQLRSAYPWFRKRLHIRTMPYIMLHKPYIDLEFVEKIIYSSVYAISTNIDKIMQLRNIRKLDIIVNESLSDITYFNRIEKLSLYNNITLSNIPVLKYLNELYIFNNTIKKIPKLPNLKLLSIFYCKDIDISDVDSGLEHLKIMGSSYDISKFTNLKSLLIINGSYKIDHITSLKSLSLQDSSIITHDMLLPKSLIKLTISHTNYQSRYINISKLHNLKHLILTRVDVDQLPISLEKLYLNSVSLPKNISKLNNLKKLRLSNIKDDCDILDDLGITKLELFNVIVNKPITNSTIKKLVIENCGADISKLCGLEELKILNCGVNIDLTRHPELKTLLIKNYNGSSIFNISTCKKLVYLYIDDSSSIYSLENNLLIKTLIFNGNNISDISMLKQLEELHICNNLNIRDISANTLISKLILCNSAVKDVSMLRYISYIQHNTEIKRPLYISLKK